MFNKKVLYLLHFNLSSHIRKNTRAKFKNKHCILNQEWILGGSGLTDRFLSDPQQELLIQKYLTNKKLSNPLQQSAHK